MTEVELASDVLDKAEWQALLAACGRSPIQQHWDYGRFMAALGRGVERFVLRPAEGAAPIGLAQIVTRRMAAGVQIAAVHRAPLFVEAATEAQRQASYAALSRRYSAWAKRFLFWTPELPAGPEALALMRRHARRRPVLTGGNTGWLDLRPPAEVQEAALHGKWRNALTRARKAGLRLERSRGGKHLHWLLGQTDALRQARRFEAVTKEVNAGFIERFLPREDVLQVTAMVQNRPAAACLFLRHGRSATYYLGYNTEEGRKTDAHNLCLWEGMQSLKAAGTDWLDLGGFDTVDTPGIARFKLRTGCTVWTMAGTFL